MFYFILGLGKVTFVGFIDFIFMSSKYNNCYAYTIPLNQNLPQFSYNFLTHFIKSNFVQSSDESKLSLPTIIMISKVCIITSSVNSHHVLQDKCTLLDVSLAFQHRDGILLLVACRTQLIIILNMPVLDKCTYHSLTNRTSSHNQNNSYLANILRCPSELDTLYFIKFKNKDASKNGLKKSVCISKDPF